MYGGILAKGFVLMTLGIYTKRGYREDKNYIFKASA